MRFVLRLLLVVAVGLGVAWIVRNVELGELGDRVRAEGGLGGAVEEVVPDLDVTAIREELEQTGRVVRRKAGVVAETLADATRDGRTTAAIEARLALDPSLSALDVSVDTTNGRVTLAGSADSAPAVARAIQIALEVDGVYEVISTLQVRPGGGRAGEPEGTVDDAHRQETGGQAAERDAS